MIFLALDLIIVCLFFCWNEIERFFTWYLRLYLLFDHKNEIIINGKVFNWI